MELKNAVAVCLISLFSATLVLLIARALDREAAARIEPQLAKIVEELQAIRKSGGVAAAPGKGTASLASDNALMVYYFHGARCPTCRAAEASALATLEDKFASQLKSGEVIWKVLDFDNDPAAKKLATDFGVASSTIVLVKMKDGVIDRPRRLGRTLALAEDKPALSAYLQHEINEMLKTADGEPALGGGVPEIPVPTADTPSIPVPSAGREPNRLRVQGEGGAIVEVDADAKSADNGPVVPTGRRDIPAAR